MALAAIGTLTITVLLDLPVQASAFAASDLKTVYASAWCMRHGLDAYNFAHLEGVFRAQGVALPTSWYGHAPVYPPFTLALLSPLTLLSMTHAVYLTVAVSALLMVMAVAALLRYAEENFGFSPAHKMWVVALFAAGPLLAFGLSIGNLSVAAAALCLYAFARRGSENAWVPASALALAVVLKPHLAIWMLIALLLVPERWSRRVAVRAAGLSICTGAIAALAIAPRELPMQIRGFLAMMHAEVARGGSMNFGNREALPVVSQITSLHSLVGFWTTSPVTAVLVGLALAGLFAVLAWQTLEVRGERDACVGVAAWCAFGLLTTYHRAHDATVLLVLTPWLVEQLRKHPRLWEPWAAAVLYAAMSIGPGLGTIAAGATEHGARSVTSFLFLRQAALADLILFGVLLWCLIQSNRGSRPGRTQWSTVRRVHVFQKAVSTAAAAEVTATTSQ